MAKFQVKLGGEWKDYGVNEDKILKRAYMAGFPTATFRLRGQNYTYDFVKMRQINSDSGKERCTRQPRKWKPPAKPLVPAGPTTVITVPAGSPGTTIQVPHPRMKGAFISVRVPASARAGQAMLVPVPFGDVVTSKHATPEKKAPAAKSSDVGSGRGSSTGWSTGGKVAAGTAAVGAAFCGAVAGVVLGEHIAEHGVDATLDAAGDGIADAAEATGEFAVDAGEFVVDAAEDLGDFVMDLF
jgi:hypothetical protein